MYFLVQFEGLRPGWDEVTVGIRVPSGSRVLISSVLVYLVYSIILHICRFCTNIFLCLPVPIYTPTTVSSEFEVVLHN